METSQGAKLTASQFEVVRKEAAVVAAATMLKVNCLEPYRPGFYDVNPCTGLREALGSALDERRPARYVSDRVMRWAVNAAGGACIFASGGLAIAGCTAGVTAANAALVWDDARKGRRTDASIGFVLQSGEFVCLGARVKLGEFGSKACSTLLWSIGIGTQARSGARASAPTRARYGRRP